NFGTQDLYAIGTSSAYNNADGTLRATGTAAGPGSVSMPNQSTFAPSADFGYFRHFAQTDWLWGARLSYTYFGVTSTVDPVRLPQQGEYTEDTGAQRTTIQLLGHAVAKSSETASEKEIGFAPFIGRQLKTALRHIGAGPTYPRPHTKTNPLGGFANIP